MLTKELIYMSVAKTRNSEASKENILAAAEEEFSKKGLYGARVDAIAEAAGINKRMLYAYFGTKEDLYSATLTNVYTRLADVENELSIEDNPEEAIRQFVDTYFTFFDKNPNFVKLIMWENLNEGKFIEKTGAAMLKSTSVTTLKAILSLGREKRIFISDVKDSEFIFAINMFCFSYFSNRYTMPSVIKNSDETSLAYHAKFVADILIDKLKSGKGE